MNTMLNIKDVVAIVESHLDWRVANEAQAKHKILAALHALANQTAEDAARDRLRARGAPFSVDPSPRLAALEARLSDADDTMGARR